MRRYMFGPCKDDRHLVCAGSFVDLYSVVTKECSCTCHNKGNEIMDYTIKLKTEVTGVDVTLTPDEVEEAWAAIDSMFSPTSATYARWERLVKAVRSARKGV